MRSLANLCLVALLAFAAGAAARPDPDFRAVEAGLDGLVVRHGLTGASLRLGTGAGEVHRSFRGGYDATTRPAIASASKWLSALTLARLVEAGRLRWDDSIGDYFPEAPAATHAITLEQLFSHTSGIASGEAPCLSNRFTTLQACAADILAQPLSWAPGTVFAYGGNSMQVAGALAERATGETWDELFLAEMVLPLGLTATDWLAGSNRAGYVPTPNPRIAGGARSTLDDYARVVDMVLAGGRVGEAVFLDAGTLAFMALDRTTGLPIADSPESRSDQGYGLGQWIEARDARGLATRVSSPGAFGFTPWVDFRQGSNGVLLVQGNGAAMREDIFDVQQAALDALDFRRRTQARERSEAPGPPPPRRPRLDATRRAL